MLYVLGIITGMLIALITVVVTLFIKPNLERATKQIESRIKKKGELFEPETNSEVESWAKSIEQDEYVETD